MASCRAMQSVRCCNRYGVGLLASVLVCCASLSGTLTDTALMILSPSSVLHGTFDVYGQNFAGGMHGGPGRELTFRREHVEFT
jgi:hypothetical protein